MKTKSNLPVVLSVFVVFTVFAATSAHAEMRNQAFGLGARVHTEHSEFDELPFADDDISYGAVYEYHANDAYWQLGVLYAQDLDEATAVDYVITPQLNLILKDAFWRGGVGILGSYIEPEMGDGDWTDLYWQFLLGVSVPFLFNMNIEANAYYPFERWGDVSEFDVDDIEYGVWLTHAF